MCGLRTGKHSEKPRQEAKKDKKSSPAACREKYIGDGLTLSLDTNEKDLEMTGDGCRLTLASNRGRIRINGDGCRVRIEINTGDIEYRGDGGRVSLGPDSTGTKVHYFGEGGRIQIAGWSAGGKTRGRTASASGGTASTRRSEPRKQRLEEETGEPVVVEAGAEKPTRKVVKTTSKTVHTVYEASSLVSGKTNSTRISNKRSSVEV